MSEQLFRDVAAPSVRVGHQTWKTIPLSIARARADAWRARRRAADGDGRVAVTAVGDDVRRAADHPAAARSAAVDAAAARFDAAADGHPESRRRADRRAVPDINPEPRVADACRCPSLFTGPADARSPACRRHRCDADPATPPPPVTKPLPIGGNIKEPSKIHHVRPVYPAIAQNAKISGIVIIEATIGRDGTVIETKVLRSVPLLDQAALDAVKQWRFTPTLLNGVPVPVVMTVTVNFTLQLKGGLYSGGIGGRRALVLRCAPQPLDPLRDFRARLRRRRARRYCSSVS